MPGAYLAPPNNPYGPLISFATENVLPPAAVYVTPEDQIIANGFSNVAGSELVLNLRLLSPDGTVRVEHYAAISAGNPHIGALIIIPPSEGYLLSVVVNGTGVTLGQMFATVALSRGVLSSTQMLTSILMSGYVSENYYLAYPPSVLQPPFAGAGYLRSVTTTAPAGQGCSFTVPTRLRWRIISARVVVATDATAGNRTMELLVQSSLGELALIQQAPATQSASTTVGYCFGAGLESSQNPGAMTAGLPTDLQLPEGYQLLMQPFGQEPGDQLSEIVLYVEEWVGY